ncbi:FAD/NAD(P)-binding protein [Nocardioides sp. Y6]|uniref:FAD/NAD(P)-binding protein n=1 Tax=Nocardioides malaquae TaxID=2773426 RepID=A0ABR9RXG4_9ACTN|nr:FAD/NAD(P)-binding protein [Nocardioides malaquae]MBE7325877.1 FAD/NAD(P)-binding protein [Nocardioides malaquae]
MAAREVTTCHRPRVVVVGAGAAGTLTALHLLRTAGRRSTGIDVVLVDPADRWGRGTAFGTPDAAHLLNVTAAGMSALPEDPGHFVAWLDRELPEAADPYSFQPRHRFALYLDDTLADARAAAPLASLQHVRTQATAVRRTADGVAVRTADGREVTGSALVVATGLPSVGHAWAPQELRDSAFFVADPWAPGALDVVRRDRSGPADVLIVGTGLTMVDVVLSLSGRDARPDRVLHAISRSGRLPKAHLPVPRLATIPDVSDWGSTLEEVRAAALAHVERVREATGDWRPAVDGLRFQVATLWQRLSEEDRLEFLARDAGAWGVARHKMASTSEERLAALTGQDRLLTTSAEVLQVEPLPRGGLEVTLSDGTTREVGWVVNCTGPQGDVRLLGNPFLDDLLRPRPGAALATAATAGMGVRTDDGRVLDGNGYSDAPIWTLGALRRGELWESTAVPEIRSQALAVATQVLDAVAPLPRRLEDGRVVGGHHPVARPRDPLGLPLSTTSEAAAAYNQGLERLMLLQDGAEDKIREATELDPTFALAHAALAMLGHESGARTDVAASLTAAHEAVRRRGDDREASLVDVITRRVQDVRRSGAQALMSHVATYPRDVLAVSAAVPTIAFSGVVDVQREAWDLVEGLAPAYGDHWWYISLLAFTRQDQGRSEEAGLLAEAALSCEPSSGHAVHALTHVMYETGQHEAGRVWLDHWVRESGRSASHRAHFAWHSALHDLALGDLEALRGRYYSQLAPPTVTGVRSLVDSASLLWRWRVAVSDWDTATSGLAVPPAFAGETAPPPVAPVLTGLDDALLLRPATPFVALHSAFALAADGDTARLELLRHHCAGSGEEVIQTVVVPVVEALLAFGRENWSRAVELLRDVEPVLVRAGGSAAQREIVEETLIHALTRAGRPDEAGEGLHRRLDRRTSPLDRRRAESLQARVTRV